MEDRMALRIREAGAEGVPSYTIISDEDARDADAVKGKIDRAGFDGVAMMRIVGVEKERTWVPGEVTTMPAYYRTPWGYYRRWWPVYYDPGYVRTDEIVTVEVVLYSLARDTMIWAGESETTNPESAPKLVDGVAKAVTADLKKHGLLKA
jgi:hypothetical protein